MRMHEFLPFSYEGLPNLGIPSFLSLLCFFRYLIHGIYRTPLSSTISWQHYKNKRRGPRQDGKNTFTIPRSNLEVVIHCFGMKVPNKQDIHKMIYSYNYNSMINISSSGMFARITSFRFFNSFSSNWLSICSDQIQVKSHFSCKYTKTVLVCV